MRHPLEHLFKLRGVVMRADDRLERVAVQAVLNGGFLFGGSRETHEPFGIGELSGEVGGFAELQIQHDRIVCGDV